MATSGSRGQTLKADERWVFARNIRLLRLSLGLTTTTVGQRIGTAATYVAMVERGENNTSIDRMATFAQALGHPLHALLNPRFIDDNNLSGNILLQTKSQDREVVAVPAKGRHKIPDK